MNTKTEGVVQIFLSVLIVVLIIIFSEEIEKLAAFGYAGAFFIAVLGSATIVLPSPAFAAIIAMAAYFDPVLLGIVAGIGSGIGELTGYVAGQGTRNILNSHIKESKKIEDFVRKYNVIAVFILAFIPNPLFDAAGLVAGGLKIKWWKFLIACIAGRVLRYVLLAVLGHWTLEVLT